MGNQKGQNPGVSIFVSKAVDDALKKVRNQARIAALSAIGFSDKWGGKLEVDHCNGRTSVLTDLIKDKATEFFDNLKIETIKLSATDKKRLRTSMKAQALEHVKYRSREMVQNHINGLVEKLMKEEIVQLKLEETIRIQIQAELSKLVHGIDSGDEDDEDYEY